jgi:hypothetical protein
MSASQAAPVARAGLETAWANRDFLKCAAIRAPCAPLGHRNGPGACCMERLKKVSLTVGTTLRCVELCTAVYSCVQFVVMIVVNGPFFNLSLYVHHAPHLAFHQKTRKENCCVKKLYCVKPYTNVLYVRIRIRSGIVGAERGAGDGLAAGLRRALRTRLVSTAKRGRGTDHRGGYYHPLHTRFTNISGASLSDATVRAIPYAPRRAPDREVVEPGHAGERVVPLADQRALRCGGERSGPRQFTH